MRRIILFVSIALAIGACQKGANTSTATTTPVAASNGAGEIAFVNVDSVMSSYEYAKDLSKKYETLGKSKESELKDKASRFERRAVDFQGKVQQHLITSAQAEKVGQELEQERQNLGVLQNQMQQELAYQEREMLLTLNDSLVAVLKDFNKDGKYKMIIRNTVVLGNVIVSTPDADLTSKVIELLNGRYKKPEATK
jgi:outer membrane protein